MKNHLILGLLIIALVLVGASAVLAGKPNFVPANVDTPQGPIPIVIPEHAVELSPGIYSLGQARDVDGRMVEGFMFIDNKREAAKPPWAGSGKGGGEKCYAFLAKGAHWKTTEQYVTGDGVDVTLTDNSLNTWDTEVAFDIFATRDTATTTDGADSESPDGKNEVEFANLGETDTIAYTIVWGIFYGQPSQRELVEWDAVFNSSYPWSLSGESGNYDFQNIATHEFGHSAGMAHPDDSCTEETMYRFAALGETKKRDLNTGDVAGIQELYK